MAKPKEGERRNGRLIGEDGLTSKERNRARQAERKAERAPRLAAIVEKHGLGTSENRGTAWTTPAVSEFLWKEFRFTLFRSYVNCGSGKKGVPLVGRCEKCGEVSRPFWYNVLEGRSPCTSSDCSRRRMPPDHKMNRVFKARGFELVGDYPTGSTEHFTLRHVAADPEHPGQEPCKQVMTTRWADFNSGRGCGVCDNKQVVVGYNDLASTDPHLVDRFVNPEEARTVTRQSKKTPTLWCASDGCKNTVTQVVYSLVTGRRSQCGEHEAVHRGRAQFHYIVPVYQGTDLIGCVWGHAADYKAAGRLWGHVKIALAHDLELGDVTLTTGLDKTLAETNDKTPRHALGDGWQSIPAWFGDDSPSRSDWDGWITESAAGVTPDQVERMLGLDKYDPTEHPRVLVPIAEFYEERAA